MKPTALAGSQGEELNFFEFLYLMKCGSSDFYRISVSYHRVTEGDCSSPKLELWPRSRFMRQQSLEVVSLVS